MNLSLTIKQARHYTFIREDRDGCNVQARNPAPGRVIRYTMYVNGGDCSVISLTDPLFPV